MKSKKPEAIAVPGAKRGRPATSIHATKATQPPRSGCAKLSLEQTEQGKSEHYRRKQAQQQANRTIEHPPSNKHKAKSMTEGSKGRLFAQEEMARLAKEAEAIIWPLPLDYINAIVSYLPTPSLHLGTTFTGPWNVFTALCYSPPPSS